jgi:uncharacterized RDD family membrane protein YckC
MSEENFAKIYLIITIIWVAVFLPSVFLFIDLSYILLGIYFGISIVYIVFNYYFGDVREE